MLVQTFANHQRRRPYINVYEYYVFPKVVPSNPYEGTYYLKTVHMVYLNKSNKEIIFSKKKKTIVTKSMAN